IHDPTLARTAGRSDAIAALTAAELSDADAGATFTRDGGSTFPYRGQGLTIPTLAEGLARFPDVPLLIEIKVPEAVASVERMLDAGTANRRVVVASLRHDAVAPLRGRTLSTGASSNEVARLIWRASVAGAPTRLPYQALCIPLWYYGLPLPVVSLARAGRHAGAVTHVWTVDDPHVAKRLWLNGIQGIVTNDPAIM